jgi:hypothetical protein
VDAAARAWLKEPLRAAIDDATSKGELWTRDWDTTPIPKPPASSGQQQQQQPAWGGMSFAQQQAQQQQQGYGAYGGANGWPTPAGAAAAAAAATHAQAQQAMLQRHAAAQQQQQRGYGYRRERSSSRSSSRSRSPSPRRGSRRDDAFGRGGRGGRNGRGAGKRAAAAAGAAGAAGAGWAHDAGKRARREGRFGDGRADGTGAISSGASGAAGTARRRALAAMHLAAAAADGGEGGGGAEPNWDALTIRGTCSTLEKSYFRLTSAPDPATVRPAPVLAAALAALAARAGEHKWLYVNDQCKALRQDLTVQRLRTSLAAAVYEFHARAALDAGDLAEYNQCQTVLTSLYAEPGVKSEAVGDFAAYRVIYASVAGTRGAAASRALAAAGGAAARAAPAVAHALAVRSALASNNYAAFFRLYVAAPGKARALMDAAVERMRFAAVSVIARVYRPTVPIAALLPALGFDAAAASGAAGEGEAAEESGEGALREWLRAHGAVFTGDADGELDCKASAPALFVPIAENAVSHGDADLDVSDFLKSWAQPPAAP